MLNFFEKVENDNPELDKISLLDVYFPGFIFTLQIFLILTGLAMNMVILRHYRINFIYLLKMDPGITFQAVEIFKVKTGLKYNHKYIYKIFRMF